MKGYKLLMWWGALLMVMALLPVSDAGASRQVVIQLNPSSGMSEGVFSTTPQGWGTDSSTTVLAFGNYIGPLTSSLISCRTYLWFPLSAIPPTAQVRSAILSLYVDDWPFAGAVSMGVYRVTAPWTENFNWAGRPPADTTPAGVAALSSAPGARWYDWDVTSLLQNWVAIPTTNYGCMLSTAPTPDFITGTGWAAAAHGRTSVNPEVRPRLTVVFDVPGPPGRGEPVPEPATILLLIGGLTALASYVRLRLQAGK
jgi:hypothetical protein